MEWRQQALKQGLLIPPDDADEKLTTGVSLAWLQQFVKALPPEIRNAETQAVVRQLVIPATKLSVGTGTRRTRLLDWVPAQHKDARPTWYIIHYWADKLSDVVHNIIDHLVAEAKHIQHVQQQEHQEAAAVRDIGDKTVHQEVRSPDPRAAPPPAGPTPFVLKPTSQLLQQVLNNSFVWLDVVCTNQHVAALANGPPPELIDVRAALSACSNGALLIMDRNMRVLSRCWCMYEAWAIVYYGNCERLRVVFAGDITLEDVSMYQDLCNSVDLLRGDCSRAADKTRIVAEVKHAVGLSRMQKLLPQALMRSSRAGLRWSTQLEHLSMYAAILLKNQEWAQVQTILHSIPEIHDDEKTLQDIRDVFKMYDTDGSGELDQDEFIEVLGVAGFTHEESQTMFTQVDADGGGSVSMVEFEKWWIESQRQQSTRYNAKVDLGSEALDANLKAMMGLLERQGLNSHMPFYRSAVEALRLAYPASKAARQPRTLAPTPVQGDWHSVAEQCAWKISNKDYTGAARIMRELLLWNADTLLQDPTTLPVPSTSNDLETQLQMLIAFLRQFSTMLGRVPLNYRQAEYFMRAADEIQDNVLAPLLAHTDDSDGDNKHRKGKGVAGDMSKRKSNKGKKKKKGHQLFPGKYDMQREAIVSDMVRLKYGPDTMISSKLIVEAEKSLSMWMAAQKGAQGKGGSRDDREAVNLFTSSYLSGGSALSGGGGGTRAREGGGGVKLPFLSPSGGASGSNDRYLNINSGGDNNNGLGAAAMAAGRRSQNETPSGRGITSHSSVPDSQVTLPRF